MLTNASTHNTHTHGHTQPTYNHRAHILLSRTTQTHTHTHNQHATVMLTNPSTHNTHTHRAHILLAHTHTHTHTHIITRSHRHTHMHTCFHAHTRARKGMILGVFCFFWCMFSIFSLFILLLFFLSFCFLFEITTYDYFCFFCFPDIKFFFIFHAPFFFIQLFKLHIQHKTLTLGKRGFSLTLEGPSLLVFYRSPVTSTSSPSCVMVPATSPPGEYCLAGSLSNGE